MDGNAESMGAPRIWRSHALYLYERVISALAANGWRALITGPIRRGVDTIDRLDCLVDLRHGPEPDWAVLLDAVPDRLASDPSTRSAVLVDGSPLKFFRSPTATLGYAQIAHTGPDAFVHALRQRPAWDAPPAETEERAFERLGLPFIPPYLRSRANIIEMALAKRLFCQSETTQPTDQG